MHQCSQGTQASFSNIDEDREVESWYMRRRDKESERQRRERKRTKESWKMIPDLVREINWETQRLGQQIGRYGPCVLPLLNEEHWSMRVNKRDISLFVSLFFLALSHCSGILWICSSLTFLYPSTQNSYSRKTKYIKLKYYVVKSESHPHECIRLRMHLIVNIFWQ